MTDRLSVLPILFNPLNMDELRDKDRILIHQIDECLPQTQCGLCGHIDGCLPYAHGIVMAGEAHNLCVPGGQSVTDDIHALLCAHGLVPKQLAATPSKWQNDPATDRPMEVRAVIDEDDCIGCTKCIPACPVDAIIGTAKHMHTVITHLCTGCELCLAPCPVDCIRLEPQPRTPTPDQRASEQAHLRRRYHQHLNRIAQSIADGTKPVVNAVESTMTNVMTDTQGGGIDKALAKNTIELAKVRTQIKKLGKQLTQKPDPKRQRELDNLHAKLRQLEKTT